MPTSDAGEAWASAPAAMQHLEQHVLPARQKAADKEASRNAEALAANPKARVNRHHANFLDAWWRHSYRRGELVDQLAELPR